MLKHTSQKRISGNRIRFFINKKFLIFLWLHKTTFSKEANEILTAAKKVYKFYFEHFNELNTSAFKIYTWDAGWWQIRNALLDQNLGKDLIEDVKVEHAKIKEKILPQIYEYGFLSL